MTIDVSKSRGGAMTIDVSKLKVGDLIGVADLMVGVDECEDYSQARHELLLLNSPEHPPTFVIRIDGDERLDEGYATPGTLMDRLAVLGAIGARVSITSRVEAALVRYLSRAYSGAFAALASDQIEGEAHDGR